MANICDNKFFFSCKNNFPKYKKFFEEVIFEEENGNGEVIDEQNDGNNHHGGSIEGWFESRWNFPIEWFKSIFKEDDECYFRCLSEEYGCDYVAMNIYSNGSWRDEQCFDI